MCQLFRNRFNLVKVFAEEGTPDTNPNPAPTPAPQAAPNYNLMSDPQVATLVEQARTDERKKLHTAVENANSQLATKDATIQTLTTRVGELTNDVAKANQVNADLQAQIDLGIDETTKTLQTKLSAAEAKIVTLEAEATVSSIKSYKDLVISKHKDVIIPEMITGNTMAEIDASVELAKAVFARIATGNTAPAPETTATPSTETTTVTNPSPTPTPTPQADQTPKVNINPMAGKKSAEAYALSKKTT